MKQLGLLILLTTLAIQVNAQLRLSLESGYVSTQYNDVRAPNGDQAPGTLFSLSDDFDDGGSGYFLRGEIAYLIASKHMLELTAVPLTIEYQSSTGTPILFKGSTFAGEDVDGQYQFNTYRVSYRYRLVDKSKVTFDLGASLLVRDARIALTQGPVTEEDTDLGYVPLVSFELNYNAADRLAFMLKGDALVGPVGRAEDIFAGLLYDIIDDQLQIKAGYRVIEGGADVDQVYNFAFFHFADLGIVYTL